MDASGYRYFAADPSHAHAYLLPTVRRILRDEGAARVFDLGCGNGSVAAALTSDGHEVVGVDPSEEGIAQANAAFPGIRLSLGSAYEDLASRFGQFPALVSLEVVEHLYAPRLFAKAAYDLLEPGGIAIISTPYHGYLKNLALALSGRMDRHFTALWDHGHIKFWSERTLTELLSGAGFTRVSFVRVGRFRPLAKSMIAIARR